MKNLCRDSRTASPVPPHPPQEERELWRRRGKDGTAKLFEDILCRGASLRIRVTGQSMMPFLGDGDVVTIRKVPPWSLRPGDLLFVKVVQGTPVLHRLVRKKQLVDGSAAFQTKGDALASMDEPVRADRVLGKVCQIEKENGSGKSRCIEMASGLWRTVNRLIAITWPVHPLVRACLNVWRRPL